MSDTTPNSLEPTRKVSVARMVDMIVRRICAKMEFADGSSKASYKHRLLLLLDEFTSLGKLPIMTGPRTAMPTCNVRKFKPLACVKTWTATCWFPSATRKVICAACKPLRKAG